MSTNRFTPASSAAASSERVPSTITRWNCSGMPLADGDEVHDDVLPGGRIPQALRVGHVALHGALAANAGLAPRARLPLQHAHLVTPVDDGVRHGRPDEAGGAGDEDSQTVSRSKFFQYRDGVGPRWPWYLEPSVPAPYGVSAGSVICTNESCPIFIPW